MFKHSYHDIDKYFIMRYVNMQFINSYKKNMVESAQEYFIGMNTGHGFIGLYNELINENTLKRLYIIKGAAGTGKSHLMKVVAEECESSGATVCRYYCSSDPSSLDCIIINNAVAILDGTSPHSLDMYYPGAVSEIIDITKFWDSDKLVLKRDEIVEYSSKKKESFWTAYNLLHNAELMQLERYDAVKGTINKEKASKCIKRLVKGLGRASGNEHETETTAMVRSIGMKGTVMLDSLEKNATTIVSVTDLYGSAYVFMKMLYEYVIDMKYDIVCSYDPIAPSLLCDIYISSSNVLITVEDSNEADRKINMKRFVDLEKLSEIRGYLRLSAKCSKAVITEAASMLSRAGDAHFNLERIYSSAMDFESLTDYTKILMKKIKKFIH